MNTFLNAIMIDVGSSVAEFAGIANSLGRARDFLSSQIEEGGLVRYHGRADAPTIGRLGCPITPDSDDTALVWRVAPNQRSELLPMALATFDQFRTTDGLYRTWLAPQARYACIDPGKDPNPADVGIQMNILLLLAQADPPAAHALCGALRQRLADDGIWVYYAIAPLIPILRLADLRKAGCELKLPPSRLQTTVPEQQLWIDLLQLLQRIENSEGTDGDYAKSAALLHEIGAEDFSLLARAPPMIYHNDLSASVRRFYWSEELGYALWLRLYFATERAQSARSCSIASKQECGGN